MNHINFNSYDDNPRNPKPEKQAGMELVVEQEWEFMLVNRKFSLHGIRMRHKHRACFSVTCSQINILPLLDYQ